MSATTREANKDKLERLLYQWSAGLASTESWVLFPAPHKLIVVASICHPSAGGMEAAESRVKVIPSGVKVIPWVKVNQKKKMLDRKDPPQDGEEMGA